MSGCSLSQHIKTFFIFKRLCAEEDLFDTILKKNIYANRLRIRHILCLIVRLFQKLRQIPVAIRAGHQASGLVKNTGRIELPINVTQMPWTSKFGTKYTS